MCGSTKVEEERGWSSPLLKLLPFVAFARTKWVSQSCHLALITFKPQNHPHPLEGVLGLCAAWSSGPCFVRWGGYCMKFQVATGKECSSFFNPQLLESWDFGGLPARLVCVMCILRKFTLLLSLRKAWKYDSKGLEIRCKWRHQTQIAVCFYPVFSWNQTPCDHDPLASPWRSGSQQEWNHKK